MRDTNLLTVTSIRHTYNVTSSFFYASHNSMDTEQCLSLAAVRLDDNQELWKSIGEWPTAHEVSNLGRVRRKAADGNWEIIKPIIANGKPVIRLGAKRKSVGRLVAMAFIELPPSPTAVVKCKDGNNMNTRASNLAWAFRPRSRTGGWRILEADDGTS